MARKGNKRHMKSLNAPRYFGIHKKASKYVIKPDAGRHTLERSIPVALFMKRLGIAKTSGEAKKLVIGREITVNGKPISGIGYPIGLNDIVAVKATGESYSVGISGGAKVLLERMEKGADERVCKIVGKYRTKGGKLMLRLHDGTTIEGSLEGAVDDSVKIDMDNKVKRLLKLDKDSKCLVIDGMHVGARGTIAEIKKGSMHSDKSVVVEGQDGSFETRVRNIMVTE